MTLVIFKVLNSHIWLVATILESKDTEHFHHHRDFYWITLPIMAIIQTTAEFIMLLSIIPKFLRPSLFYFLLFTSFLS